MPKSFVAILALIACGTASTAIAQSPDYGDEAGGGGTPTLVMPNLLTSPLTSGLDGGYGATGAPPPNAWTSDPPPEVPYSVEGEEQLEPETN